MNPWDAVEQLRFQYEKRISEQLKAHEAQLADKACPVKFTAWREAMERKGTAYRVYLHAVDAAVKSSISCPW